MVWGGILGEGGKKKILVREKDSWGTITAPEYVDHVLRPATAPM